MSIRFVIESFLKSTFNFKTKTHSIIRIFSISLNRWFLTMYMKRSLIFVISSYTSTTNYLQIKLFCLNLFITLWRLFREKWTNHDVENKFPFCSNEIRWLYLYLNSVSCGSVTNNEIFLLHSRQNDFSVH